MIFNLFLNEIRLVWRNSRFDSLEYIVKYNKEYDKKINEKANKECMSQLYDNYGLITNFKYMAKIDILIIHVKKRVREKSL